MIVGEQTYLLNSWCQAQRHVKPRRLPSAGCCHRANLLAWSQIDPLSVCTESFATTAVICFPVMLLIINMVCYKVIKSQTLATASSTSYGRGKHLWFFHNFFERSRPRDTEQSIRFWGDWRGQSQRRFRLSGCCLVSSIWWINPFVGTVIIVPRRIWWPLMGGLLLSVQRGGDWAEL